MVKVIHTFALNGITGIPVVVETDRFSSAEPLVSLIGLPDTAVKEALDRVRAAARSSQLTLKTGKVTMSQYNTIYIDIDEDYLNGILNQNGRQ